ncbi:MAG: nucleotidyl transferase AbiEii/AbiGii toxin family protein [Endomicrobia bacterium]|nr:nucleotidyl transferase AbiEii/AbiGii toxin family protein [Endomicrobiia bacterium]
MRNKNLSNIAASVKAKLLNIAKKKDVDFNNILLRYFQERLLYRLSVSKYKTGFVLKGGLLLIVIDVPTSRPTVDIDFLAEKLKSDAKKIESIFKEIADIGLPDGIVFNPAAITSERIKEDADYEGIRIKITGVLGKIKQQVQIDFGFGDVIYPAKQDIIFPSILSEDKIKLKGYPLEVVIAEKFEAMVKLGFINSRMKDFYDVYTILKNCSVDSAALKQAIKKTFHNRGIELTAEPEVFSEKFYKDTLKLKQWSSFLKKNNLTDIPENLEKVVLEIKKILIPIIYVDTL